MTTKQAIERLNSMIEQCERVAPAGARRTVLADRWQNLVGDKRGDRGARQGDGVDAVARNVQ